MARETQTSLEPGTPEFEQAVNAAAEARAREIVQREQAARQNPQAAQEAFKRASMNVQKMKARALLDEMEQRQDPDVRMGRKPLKPVRAFQVNALPDPTVIRDRDGNVYADDAEYQYKWVPTGDSFGRKDGSDTVVHKHQDAWGYEPVLAADGTPITGAYGIAMRISHEQKALVVAATSPEGAINPEAYFQARSEAVIESANRSRGQEMMRPFQGSGHGSHRSDALE